MTLAQDKALEFIFCEPITEGLWDRVFANTLDDETDIIWELYMNLDNEELQKVIENLKDEFQTMYRLGYNSGYDSIYKQ